jgi:hypothetical protein
LLALDREVGLPKGGIIGKVKKWRNWHIEENEGSECIDA